MSKAVSRRRRTTSTWPQLTGSMKRSTTNRTKSQRELLIRIECVFHMIEHAQLGRQEVINLNTSGKQQLDDCSMPAKISRVNRKQPGSPRLFPSLIIGSPHLQSEIATIGVRNLKFDLPKSAK
jgi:hypothetical protein